MATVVSTNYQDEIMLVNNAYQDGTTWKYKGLGTAILVLIEGDETTFFHAVAGLEDDPVTWLTDMVIRASGDVIVGDVVGAAHSGKLFVQPNTAVDYAAVGGLLYSTATHTGNVGTGEDILASVTIKGSTIISTAQSLSFRAWGKTANNANVKTLRVKYDDSVFCSRTMTVSVANNWVIHGTLILTANVDCESVVHDGSVTEVDIINIPETTNTDKVLAVTGEATSNDDVVLWGFKVWWDDNQS